MNKIGYQEVLNIENENFVLKDTIIYNKYFKEENIKELNCLTFDDCIFDKCIFENDIHNLTFTNCKFTNCDFSNIHIEKSGFHFITMVDSKLVGTSFIDCSIRNSILNNNLSNMLYFSSCNIYNIIFEENSMISSTFQLIKLSKTKFVNNKMKDIEIINTSLKNIDLSSNDINGIKINLNDIKECIIDYNQIYDLINLLEIKIK